MAKRFIDTGLYDDDWFMDLSKDGKLTWIYFVTKCNHAGILKLNAKLCKVQTGVNNISTVIQELGNRLVTLDEGLFFIPKFIDYQYPGFPNSNVNAHKSVIDILNKYQLFKDEKVTLPEGLLNPYGYGLRSKLGYKSGSEEKKEINISFEDFWNLYDKKVGDKDKITKKWQSLSDPDREAIIKYIPGYLKSKPDKQFRKDPSTFLNNKSWNDEIIQPKDQKKTNMGLIDKERDYSQPQKF